MPTRSFHSLFDMIFPDYFSFLAQFQLFGIAHLLALIVTFLTAFALTRYARKSPDAKILKQVRYTMAVLLVTAVSLDPVLTLVRYGTGSFGWEMVVKSALPLYLCDVVSFLLAYALVTGSQRITEIGFLWGIAGTTQGLITPILLFDGSNIEFYVFFLQHGGVPIAAIFLVWGLKIVPEKGALLRIFCWSWGYMAIVMTINWIIGQNYGFLNELPNPGTLFDHMGPYPYYLITLQGIAFTLYCILLKIAPKPPTEKLPEISGKTWAS